MCIKRKKIFKCLLCGGVSFNIICKKCQKEYLTPDLKIENSTVSFYDYENIKELIRYKYHKFGHRIYNVLAENSLKIFAKNIKEKFYLIPVDDRCKKGFSHTAVLAKSMQTSYLTPLYGVLHAGNDIKYAGKTLDYRLKHPREFSYKGIKNIDVILIDDVLTTSLTLKEAEKVLTNSGVNVVLKIVLCDLRK